ncbi:hypothetical protein CAEBREN_23525 [Caenorhabditis brenneri]|uniref:Uncharacterized protein n=1 Tax=Caenorhabditis brenneri TaxID=135651 RepID=G0MJK9_CAEBE|nr:hypothetical protein CAEBREN_23525 [Caenorhabditis brenneri]
MTRRRKPIKKPSLGGRSALQNLQTIGHLLNQPVLTIDFETTKKQSRQSQQAQNEEFRRLILFSRIPACCLSAKGIGPSEQMADESAAHAMLDFFRLTISPEFVSKFLACETDESLEPLAPAFALVLGEFKKAIDADYLLIRRCGQLELTSATTIRGKEVKKRVILNIKNSAVGYGAVANVPQNNVSDEIVMIRDDDDDTSEGNSRSESVDSDIIIVDEVTNGQSQQQQRPLMKRQMRDSPKQTSSKSPPRKSPSPQVEHLRKLDEHQRASIEEGWKQERLVKFPHQYPPNYFGEFNKSNAGPPDVFCCHPGANTSFGGGQYEAAQYSDESEDSDDEGAREVPKKRARIAEGDNDDDDDIVVLNMTSSSAGTAIVPKEVKPVEPSLESPEKQQSESEIGDIVDEWNEVDDDEPDEEVQVLDVDKGDQEEEVTTTTTPNGTMNGFYDGHPTHQSFIESRNLPKNYQARTIGVVLNEHLYRAVEKYVESATEKCYDSVHSITSATWLHYKLNIQDSSTYNLKLRARDLLEKEIQKLLPERAIKLLITGSTVNGCGSFNSDMDMCLCYPTFVYHGKTFDDFYCDRKESQKILRKVDRAVRRCKIGANIRSIIGKCSVIPAKVPIVKCELTRAYRFIDVDINVNNIAGIYNSHLTHYYSLIDARFPALALVVKHWACVCGVGNAPDGYLNSYSLILMVIHYLQCGVTPAVLPNLQYLFPDVFDRKIPIDDLRLYGEITDNLPTSVPNTWSIGELLIGFFFYFAHFDFDHYAISVRSAQVVPRSSLPRETEVFAIFIEEPFDAINTARSVRTSGHLRDIKKAIRTASETLSPHKRRFNLLDIGVKVANDNN